MIQLLCVAKPTRAALGFVLSVTSGSGACYAENSTEGRATREMYAGISSLQIARAFDCNTVHVELAYVPVTDLGYVSGRAEGDPFRDRFEIRLINLGLPEGTLFDYQSPQPLPCFFSVLRRLEDGSLLDVTSPQIDVPHIGRPAPQKKSFVRTGETLTDRISYFAISTIVPDGELIPGNYLVRVSGFEMIRTGRGTCGFEPIELPLTIIDSTRRSG